ncbi:MAG: hypothetical protein ABIH23_25875, partial [bacterium]
MSAQNSATKWVAMELHLNDNQKEAILAFLDKKDCEKLLGEWLEDAGLSKFRAKLIAKAGVFALSKIVHGLGKLMRFTVRRAVGDLAANLEEEAKDTPWLIKKVLDKLAEQETRKKVKNALLSPPKGMEQTTWNRLDEQTKFRLSEFAKLDALALSLGDLQAKVRLRIDTPLPLTAQDAERPSRLLRAHNEFIPLLGREPDLKRLKKFRDGEETFRWWVIIGEGGVGKTRLLHEFAKESRELKWSAGFLDEQDLRSFADHPGASDWEPVENTWIIVDYAAGKTEHLKWLVERCAGYGASQEEDTETVERPALRLILLERHADMNEGWLGILRGRGEGAKRDAIRDTLEEEIYELQPPGRDDPLEVTGGILRRTFEEWAKVSEKTAPGLPDLSEDSFRQLRINTGGRPLYLQMAALHAC